MIYIHIPFCRSFCTYCDFYSELAAVCRGAEDERRQEMLFNEYAEAVAAEIGMRGNEISDEVNTLYIGGGTPSVLPLSVLRTILAALKNSGNGGPYDEFTIEVNPEDIVTRGERYVEGLLELGVNRISMGVQSFDDGILRFMNRRHNAAAARKAYSILERAGVGNISIDLIFGLPQLSDDMWKDVVMQALEISSDGVFPKHISSYQLSVEPGSALTGLVEKGLWKEAPDELCARQYSILCEILARAGYNHYEISNFALNGYEAKHNSAYWHYVPYVGFGPGAHSFISDASDNRIRRWNRQDLKAYLKNPAGVSGSETLDSGQVTMEKVMLALRTSEGIGKSFLYASCDAENLARHIEDGNLIYTPQGNVRIPENRFFVSDNIIADII